MKDFYLIINYILHASLIDKKVVAINFWDYYFTKENYTPRFDGVIFFEIK